ncbi:MAG: response regulator [Armatimonadota bacterium]|nr:response regulator [Armatimonadota bacterium]
MPCLLVVDDDEALQLMVGRLAEKHGFEVRQALDGEEALASVAERRPDLILLDIMMPRLDGRDVLRRLKADPATRDIPVIVFSARGEQSDRLLGLELGADDYVDKPFSIDLLVRKIEYRLWKTAEGQ